MYVMGRAQRANIALTPADWSLSLYGNFDKKSDMQSNIAKLREGQDFGAWEKKFVDKINELKQQANAASFDMLNSAHKLIDSINKLKSNQSEQFETLTIQLFSLTLGAYSNFISEISKLRQAKQPKTASHSLFFPRVSSNQSLRESSNSSYAPSDKTSKSQLFPYPQAPTNVNSFRRFSVLH